MNKKHISTKENILQTTIDLLNKQGLQNVTFRDVADALHISLGNITYYFHKWDNLMDVIFTDYCVKDVKELYLYFPTNIHEIAQYISRIYDLQIKYTFLFSNFYLFFNVFPRYNHFKEEFFIDRMDKMRLGFIHLAEQNYMYLPSKDHDYDLLTKICGCLLLIGMDFRVCLTIVRIESPKNNFLCLYTIFPYFT